MRLAALNPERTVAVRGVTRPAVVVDENETESVGALPECFHLRWAAVSAAQEGALPLLAMDCEIAYATAGVGLVGGLDRGRTLAAMDKELMGALQQWPQNVVKRDFTALANGASAVPLGTRVWWSDVVLGAAESKANLRQRTARVTVMTLTEQGES